MLKRRFAVEELVEIGVVLALAVVLGMFRIFRMPQGGSISLEMVPIFYIAFKYGLVPGIVTGTLYGVLQLFLGAYIVHPLQLILDYPLAFALLGVAGLFKRRVEKSPDLLVISGAILIGTLGRFLSHIFSGVIFFSQYAPDEMWGLSIGNNPYLYSFLYNVSFLLPEALITLLVVFFMKRILFKGEYSSY